MAYRSLTQTSRHIAAALVCAAACCASQAASHKLVLLHTNDTHSQIEPTADGRGGILQRKAVIDSVRRADRNVVAIDAGDGVQGSLYFKFFRGDADYPLLNQVGYDYRILGNHEFDNGIDELARAWRQVTATPLSSNYDFSATPARGIFRPWDVRKIEGHKVGFIALNIDPRSLIVADNYKGMEFAPVVQTADSLAHMLRTQKGCDLIVAVTHIGYHTDNGKEDDVTLARMSRGIDIIIGGHSHTLVDPATPDKTPCLIPNSDGRPVLVTQAGKSGLNIGRIEVDLDRLQEGAAAMKYSLIPVTDRFDSTQLDRKMAETLRPFRQVVDSVEALKVATVTRRMPNKRNSEFANWTGDFGMWYGRMAADSLSRAGKTVPRPDLSIMNVGGIRNTWDAGDLTEGRVLSTFPFSNRYVIMSISGADLLETLRVAAAKGGEAVGSSVKVITDAGGNLLNALVDGIPLDPDAQYTVGTIDYVAWGNDDMESMARGKWLWSDEVELAAPVLRYVKYLDSLGLPVEADPTPRFVRSIH